MTYEGACHCRAVIFSVEAPEAITCQECNCSICRPSAYLHLIVPARSFRLIQGEDALTTYTFNSGIAKHLFCRVCGIKSFYVPRSNPDGFSVNVRCLTPQPERLEIVPFDGVHWEQNAGSISHLSK